MLAEVMGRRLLVEQLHPGEVALGAAQAHHARDVLRLAAGDAVELFTPGGARAQARLVRVTAEQVVAQVDAVLPARTGFALTIASAVPKGPRADWMIEKLSELGVARFVPLKTQRSIVHPEGAGKMQRWERIAQEAARQSHRDGVMRIEDLTPLPALLGQIAPGTFAAWLSTGDDASPITESAIGAGTAALLLIGPEGGWSEAEAQLFGQRHLTPLSLGGTILRVETAALAAAAVVAAMTCGALIELSPARHPTP